ncbi:hypothetical protein ABZ436_23440 [Micromonospora matsumotoense]|uniref:hypothetical protein n=1 Tax=Micromonospora matsumotoense TaxID=121616 RepID=UPI0033D9937B
MLRKLVPVAVPVGAILLLGGCTSAPDPVVPHAPTPQRTLPQDAAPTGTEAPAPGGDRSAATGVRLRLDTTDAEESRLWEEWKTCMFAHGGKDSTAPIGIKIGTSRRSLDVEGSPTAAHEKCQPKKPLPPVELDDRTNPRYAEQWQDMVQCLRRNGLQVTATKPGEWRYDSPNAGQDVDDVEALQDRCTRETFGARK